MIYERGDGALLAWKLDSRVTIVDVVVVLDNGVVGGSIRAYWRIRRKETVNTQQ